LETVKTAVAAEDLPLACSALLEYYRTSDTAPWLRSDPPKPGTGRVPEADAILEDTFTLYTITAKVPRRANGGLDWTYNGPNDDREWGWGLNRQQWGRTLIRAYQSTGNPIYIEGFDRFIRDWITSNPYPGKANNTPQWRGLETYMRMVGSWSTGFYALQETPEFTPATRILMLSSIPDHAHYARNFHAGGGNWITMELYGLATVAVCWPEFSESDAWFEYAMNRLLPEMSEQVYPDGVQKELTSHYHRVAVHNFYRFAVLAERVGRDVPEDYRSGIERMVNYLAYSMRPSGYGPLNNDSNLDHTRPEILHGAQRLERADWLYIATNGREGEKPDGTPSVVFPWAGQVIMRSGWDLDAHWAFFDVGPLGIGHWHYDKLHLSISAYGRDLLVDGGRYTYKGGPWRNYFVGSASHNVILMDGHGQTRYERQVSEPMTGNYAVTPDYDYARGTYDGGYPGVEGAATHTRAVVYVRGDYWIVVDRVTTDRPRTIRTLWHFHPDCVVELDTASVASVDEGKGNVRVTPVSDLPWRVELVTGRGEPNIQGWWSHEYNKKEPAVCAVYTAALATDATFAWAIIPGKGPVPPLGTASLEWTGPDAVQVRLQFPGKPVETVDVPLHGSEVARNQRPL
jgi:hypothetical protein